MASLSLKMQIEIPPEAKARLDAALAIAKDTVIQALEAYFAEIHIGPAEETDRPQA